jgi:hypothetical protein
LAAGGPASGPRRATRSAFLCSAGETAIQAELWFCSGSESGLLQVQASLHSGWQLNVEYLGTPQPERPGRRAAAGTGNCFQIPVLRLVKRLIMMWLYLSFNLKLCQCQCKCLNLQLEVERLGAAAVTRTRRLSCHCQCRDRASDNLNLNSGLKFQLLVVVGSSKHTSSS